MISEMVNLIFSLLTGLLSLLPASFVQSYLSKVGAIDYLGYVNYFIPFYRFVEIGELWLTCCGAYLLFYYVRTVQEEVRKGE